jgi:hypothetical protein
MKSIRSKFLVAAGILLVTAFGCGGANLGGNTNLFVGTFEGAYNATTTPTTSGTVSPFDVDANGNVIGTLFQSPSTTALGTVAGVVTQTGSTTSGTFTGTYTPNGGTAVNVSNATFMWTTVNNASVLDVNFTEGTPAVVFSLVLIPQPNGKARPH